MASELRFDGKVVIITGAGGGLGRSHALLFGSRGAKVVVNDLGGSATGGGKSSAAADRVVEEIKAAGGEAVANYDSVEDGAHIVQSALDHFGRIDIVVNNAGILRDTTFQKMTQEDWDLIYRVHVLGAYRVTSAAWPHMRDQNYGRIIMTASAAGIYGNFGQANYSMAKLGLLGFSNTLALEGKKKNVLVNTIAPLAGSRLTETVLPKEIVDALRPEYVSPLVAWLCHESSTENGGLFEVGGGFFAKLRFQRAAGKTFKLGQPISIERVAEAAPAITSFDKTTAPADIASSMQPVMANIEAGPSKGGNAFIDLDTALSADIPSVTSSYDERDLSIYALSVGAAQNPLDAKELRYVYEMHGDGQLALPTFGVIPALGVVMQMAKEGKQAPGLNYGFDRILHGEQYLELTRPLPTKGKLTHKARVKSVFDKGKNASVVMEITSTDEAGEVLVKNELTTIVRGAGGWGGDRGPSGESNTPPERAADMTIEEKIPENQALLYRLTGDWNPLHADPSFASAFGFPRPILHGLCTFGYAARHVITAFANGDPRTFKSIKVRFADSVFPGETVTTEMWKESDTRIVFRCKVKERDKVVISHAAVELYTEIPKAKAKAAPAAANASAPAGQANEPTSGDIFKAITEYVASNPGAAKIGVVYQFKLTGPDSVWTVNLTDGNGSVGAGETAKPECTLELSDADFMAMCTGKADPQKLYFGGKLKITGNVMASQKLDFLKKIDPASVVTAMKARLGNGNAAPAPATAKDGAPTGAEVFAAIGEYVSANPQTAKGGVVFQFKLSAPDSVWTLDLKEGRVSSGETAKPECTLELSEADFLAMVNGKADPQKLYFGGQLKIGGNVMASQKLAGFLKGVDPATMKTLLAKVRGAATAKPTAAPKAEANHASKAACAPELFAKLASVIASVGDKLGARYQFVITGPDAKWHVDGKAAKVSEGAAEADATITLADADLAALARGVESAQRLYQTGRLRIEGDARLGTRLDALAGLL